VVLRAGCAARPVDVPRRCSLHTAEECREIDSPESTNSLSFQASWLLPQVSAIFGHPLHSLISGFVDQPTRRSVSQFTEPTCVPVTEVDVE
jgi:hypothetical protein